MRGFFYGTNMRKLNEIIIHCAATREGQNFTVSQIRSWHLNRGWNDIGYHYVIYLDGTVVDGRPLSKTGAHVKNRNSGTIGICYVGGVAKDGKTPKDTRTKAQKKSLDALIADLQDKYPTIKKISGHNQYANKACPSYDVVQNKKLPVNSRNKYLQKLLALAGFYAGQHDGILGEKTKAGLKGFQEARGLTVTGVFDADTVAQLRDLESKPKAPIVIAVGAVAVASASWWEPIQLWFAGWF
jgi:N-acetylmuramoyl-L-alanine amidase